jgi:general nucleoside transport system permease protein
MQLVLERRAERSAAAAIASPLIASALTLVTMAVLFAALGKDPVTALRVYFVDPLTDGYSLVEIAVKASPLTMIAVGLSLCYLANVWNIGAEGQFIIGAVCGSWLAVATQGTDAGGFMTGIWVLPAMLALGAIGGALWALIPALAKVRFGASEILVSLMLYYVADLLLDYLVRGPWRDPNGFNFPTTAEFDPVATMPLLIPETRLHAGALIALAAVAVAAAVLGRTVTGFAIKVAGQAPRAAAFAGFSADRLTILTFAVSGALAGLAGIIEAAGPVGHLQPGFSPGYGFTAIIVAFLGRLNPIGIPFAALFLSLTFIGGEQAQIAIKAPLDLTRVFQGLLLFYVLACDSLILYRLRIQSREAADGLV